MRATSLTVAALAAALLLTACDDGGNGGDTDDSQDRKAGSACGLDEMAVQVGPANAAPAAGDTGNVPVTLTNKGSRCTLKGFPGVDLYGSGMSAGLPAQEGAKAVKLTLDEGAAATFTITYERGEAGAEDTLDAKTLKISLPGATAQQSYKWSYGPVRGEDNPGVLKASVSPFVQAGD
ncbi:DUF4232 domain-containing protein [Streptomyces sp. CA-251387]|uniref:DUF4232 domain-containing protein n=1 Tax=Streptomyces sp. CA-251387 TaxID=3240064 RepID=UPI003D90FA85